MTTPTDRRVTIGIDLPGQHIELSRPLRGGDNPRFFAAQVDSILDDVKESIRGMIAAEHGRQEI